MREMYMSVLSDNYTGCTVFIYDMNGDHLLDTVVTDHNREEQQLKVNSLPVELHINDKCSLLVLTSPSPCEYLGKVKKIGGNIFIAMYQGQEKENRTATRYAVNAPAMIDTLITEGHPYSLHTPLNVTLINISTSGVRFRAPYYSLAEGDVFQMRMVISQNKKKLIAQVLNHIDKEPVSSDYGCLFLYGD